MMDADRGTTPEADAVNESDEDQYGYADYTTADLLDQAQSNFQATIMATALFLHQKGISLEEWGAFLGKNFALAWEDGKPWEAGEFMDSMLTNLRALGAEVVSAELGIDQAVATTVGFPDMRLCEFFSIDPALVVRFNEAAKTVAAKFGLNWEWKRMRDRVQYTVTRIGA
jgi:hypothetical protein